MASPRIATGPADFAHAARLMVDFNTEYDDATPDPAWWAGHLARLCSEGTARVLLVAAEDGADPVGVAIVRIRTAHWEDTREAYLAELYIAPAWRGQGLGAELLQAVVDDARSLGATYLDLTTTQGDEAACRLYERFGMDCHEGKGPGHPLAVYYELDL